MIHILVLCDLYVSYHNIQIRLERQAVFIVLHWDRLMEISGNFPGLVHICPEDPEGT
jgi:hypothetical protein